MESQYWPEEKLVEHQNEKLRTIVSYAHRNVPYYKKLFRRYNIDAKKIRSKEDLGEIPVLTKSIVKKYFNDLQVKSYKQNYYTKFTSGSTGQPTAFSVTKENQSWEYASLIRIWAFGGYTFGDTYLSIRPRDSAARALLTNCVHFYRKSFSDKDLYELHRVIWEKDIQFIMGMPSVLYLLAKYMEKNGLSLSVTAIYSTGEILPSSLKRLLKEVFSNCKVIDRYGVGGEQAIIAFQCECEDLYHLNMEHCVAEVEPSTKQVYITTLNNLRMPLIRYDTGDLAETTTRKCSCNRESPCIEKIIGRNTDIIITPDQKKITVLFFMILFAGFQGVDKFQIIQNQQDSLTIKLIVNDSYSKHYEKKICESIRHETNDSMKVSFEYVPEIPDSPSGKRRFIISHFFKGFE